MITDYIATYTPTLDTFRAVFALAERIGGTVGLTATGRIVITLPEPNAVAVSYGIDPADIGSDGAAGAPARLRLPAYLEPGTDSVLVLSFDRAD